MDGRVAAANPAVLTYCEMCGHPSDDGDRIRALEAEVERLKRYLNEEPALPEEREAVD